MENWVLVLLTSPQVRKSLTSTGTVISWPHLSGSASHLKLAIRLSGCLPEQFVGSPPGTPPWSGLLYFEGLLALLQLLAVYLQLLQESLRPRSWMTLHEMSLLSVCGPNTIQLSPQQTWSAGNSATAAGSWLSCQSRWLVLWSPRPWSPIIGVTYDTFWRMRRQNLSSLREERGWVHSTTSSSENSLPSPALCNLQVGRKLESCGIGSQMLPLKLRTWRFDTLT